MIIVLSLNWHMKRKHKSYQTPFFALDTYLRICGKVNMSMWVNIAVSVLNIILYAILIVYFKLGIEYAAVTNALSMTVGCLLNGFEKSTESMIIMLAESVVIPLVLIFVLTKLMRIYDLII